MYWEHCWNKFGLFEQYEVCVKVRSKKRSRNWKLFNITLKKFESLNIRKLNILVVFCYWICYEVFIQMQLYARMMFLFWITNCWKIDLLVSHFYYFFLIQFYVVVYDNSNIRQILIAESHMQILANTSMNSFCFNSYIF